MSDIDGPLVAGHIYDQIFSGEGEYLDPNVIPYALDEAVQRLRANRVPPSRWATSYILACKVVVVGDR